MIPSSFRVAIYAGGFADNAPESLDLSWPDIVDLFSSYDVPACEPATCKGGDCPHKTSRASWSPVEIVGRRCNENVRAVIVAVLDLDHVDDVALERARASIASENYAAVIHTTHQHTPSDGRYRLIMPLSRPCPAADWPAVRRTIVEVLELPADPVTKDLSRLYALPDSRIGIEPRTIVLDGNPIDLDDALAAAALMPETAPAPAVASIPMVPGRSILDDVTHRAEAVAICASHFPGLRRHDFALALAGTLKRHARLDAAAAERFVRDVAAAGGSTAPLARAKDAADTFRRDGSQTGIPTLRELVGDDAADEIVEAISDRRIEDRKLAEALAAKILARPKVNASEAHAAMLAVMRAACP